MKKTMIGAIALIAGLLLTGCGDDRENVAKDYIMALSNGDIKKARSLTQGEKIKYYLDQYEASCSEEKIEDVFNSYIDEYVKSTEPKDEETKLKFEKILEEEDKQIEQIKAEYKEEEARTKLYELSKNVYSPKYLDALGIKEEPLYITETFAWGAAGLKGSELFKKVFEKYSEDINRLCYVKGTFLKSSVKIINLLEVKDISADTAEVRLELIKEDDSSDKISVNLEKIKGEWKVINTDKQF